MVKILYRHFPERKVAAFLHRLEKQTIELAMLTKEFTDKIQSLEDQHFTKGALTSEIMNLSEKLIEL